MKAVELLDKVIFGEARGEPTVFLAVVDPAPFDPCEGLNDCDYDPGLIADVYAFDYNDPKDWESANVFVDGARQIKDILDAIPDTRDPDGVTMHSPRDGYLITYEANWGNVVPTDPKNLKEVPYVVVVADATGYYRPVLCDELARLASAFGWKWSKAVCPKFAQRLREKIR